MNNHLKSSERAFDRAFYFVMTVGALITLAAFFDMIFNLHLGFKWIDVVGGSGLLAFGKLVHFIGRKIFEIMGLR
jgi:hypothetical protein